MIKCIYEHCRFGLQYLSDRNVISLEFENEFGVVTVVWIKCEVFKNEKRRPMQISNDFLLLNQINFKHKN